MIKAKDDIYIYTEMNKLHNLLTIKRVQHIEKHFKLKSITKLTQEERGYSVYFQSIQFIKSIYKGELTAIKKRFLRMTNPNKIPNEDEYDIDFVVPDDYDESDDIGDGEKFISKALKSQLPKKFIDVSFISIIREDIAFKLIETIANEFIRKIKVANYLSLTIDDKEPSINELKSLRHTEKLMDFDTFIDKLKLKGKFKNIKNSTIVRCLLCIGYIEVHPLSEFYDGYIKHYGDDNDDNEEESNFILTGDSNLLFGSKLPTINEDVDNEVDD
jgi:hypothetical protein